MPDLYLVSIVSSLLVASSIPVFEPPTKLAQAERYGIAFEDRLRELALDEGRYRVPKTRVLPGIQPSNAHQVESCAAELGELYFIELYDSYGDG